MRRAQQEVQPNPKRETSQDAIYVMESIPFGGDQADTLLLPPSDMEAMSKNHASDPGTTALPSAPVVPR